MSLILVVEPEPRYVERIHDALGADGWKVQAVPGHAEALAAVASQSPELILVSAVAPGADRVVGAFSRHAGGPGVLVLLAEGAEPEVAAGQFRGEDHVNKPFTAQELRLAVKRTLTARREAPPPAAPAPESDAPKLTSHEIFGDLLAEVEDEVGGALRSRRPPPASQVQPPADMAGAPAMAAPASAASPAPARPPAAAHDDDEIQRRLEQTLSGVLRPDLRAPVPAPPSAAAKSAEALAAAAGAAAAAAAAKKPEAKRGDDVDALISKTLTGLNLEKELGRGRTALAAGKPVAPVVGAAAAVSAAAGPASSRATAAAGGIAAAAGRAAAATTVGAAQAPAMASTTGASAAPQPDAKPIPVPPQPSFAPPSSDPASTAQPTAPGQPPRAERTATGKLKFDLQDFEELTKTHRATGAIKIPTAAAVAAPAAPVPASPKPAAAPPPAASAARTAPPAAAATPSHAAPTPPPAASPAAKAADSAATVRIPVVRPEDTGQPGEHFGQYTLLERIAVGGMAELYKARMSGVEGFQKTVAIKRILPHLTDNAEFVEMFIDEGKLAAQLNHPNIAHIYDLGKIGRDYYIAMEFVEGRDLRSVLNLARRKAMPVPMGLALLIAARLASALDYAHRKRDFEGREMGLVHRDVSPQNILLTHEGDIKLVDFGIAKAVSKASQTQIGALKGKLQYMSPEQAWGRAVDPRSDIFSLGAVLFELLTGERLFVGVNEMSVLEAVREGKIRAPRDVNPAVPREVDALVLNALALEPTERYATAGELQQRLEEVLYALRPTPGHSDLAAYLQRLEEGTAAGVAPPAGETAAEAAPPAAGVVAAAAAAHRAAPAAPAPAAVAHPPAKTGTGLPRAVEVPAMAMPAAAAGHAPGHTAAGVLDERGGRNRMLLLAAMVAVVLAGVLIWFVVRGRGGAAPAPQAATPPGVTVPARQAPPARPAAGVPAGPGVAGQAAVAPAAAGVDVNKIVNQELARKEEELRRKAEADKRQLEREVEAARLAAAAKAQTAAADERAAAVPEPAVMTPVQTAPPEPIAEPAVERTEPARDPEPAAAEPVPQAPPQPTTREGDLVQLGPGVAAPQLVSYDKPQYPPAAKRVGAQGVVVVSLLVDENGRVVDTRVVEGPKQHGFNEAALAAARTARYRPATKDGVRVKVWTRLRIPFKL